VTILLDTQVFLWMLVAPERLAEAARSTLEDQNNELLFSAASSWEIAIKVGLGKLPLGSPPEIYVPDRIQRLGLVPIAVEHGDALAVASLPQHHRDPFDRLLIAQARARSIPVMTSDPWFARYDVEVFAAA